MYLGAMVGDHRDDAELVGLLEPNPGRLAAHRDRLSAAGLDVDAVVGASYGAMVGLGFAVVENVFYFVGQFGGQPAGVVGGFFVRVLASGLYGHVLYTGLTGMGIAWFVTRTAISVASSFT